MTPEVQGLRTQVVVVSQGLPAAFSTRTLFVRMLLGYNEAAAELGDLGQVRSSRLWPWLSVITGYFSGTIMDYTVYK